MNWTRWAVATAGAFITLFVTGFVIHHIWLGEFYKIHAEWWRPEAEMNTMMPLMLLAQASFAALLALVYAKGYEAGKGGVAQGLRFGLLIGALVTVPKSLMLSFVYPYPASLICSWLIGGMAEVLLAGAVIGALYKPAK